MPATTRGKASNAFVQRPFVIGVDGCKAGWVCVRLNVAGGAVSTFVVEQFADLLNGSGADAAMIIVDMPIGLADTGRRACEQEARALLKPLRNSSVFATPRRPMLGFETYPEANAWGKAQGKEHGGGLSKQAWMITPKIKEIDSIITPTDQTHIGEGHPEVAFYRLNGKSPCQHPKRKPEGALERRALLKDHGISSAYDLFSGLKEKYRSQIGEDDVYDACALALTARARLTGDAIRLGDGTRDTRGLKMEIWG